MKMARTKRTSQAKGSSASSPPSKKARVSKKSPDPKFKPKVQSSEPSPRGKAKGVVIKEPTAVSQPTPKPTHSGKGKSKEREADVQARVFMTKLDSAYQRFKGRDSGAPQPESPSSVSPSYASVSTTPSQTVREAQASVPPPHFITDDLIIENPTKYKAEYEKRSFCPIVYVDLDKLRSECHVDLSGYLDQFAPLLKIRTVYSPSVVKAFYFNMEIKDVRDGDTLVEEVLVTNVRGKQIRLSADLINTYLGVENAPTGPYREFTDAEIFSILRPGEGTGVLNFTPSAMRDEFRVLWYIYTRCLVNKGRNFSHFTGRDYHLMASIVSKEPRNLGEWILSEMRIFRFHSSTTTTIPFPSLVSYILFLHNVWYLAAGEKPVGIERFGKVHLSRMKIVFGESSAQSKASKPQRMSTSPPPSRTDEAQSSQGATPGSPGPSFFRASIQTQLQEVLQPALQSAHESLIQKLDMSQELHFHRIEEMNSNMVKSFETLVRTLVAGLNTSLQTLADVLQAQTTRLDQLEARLSTYQRTSSDVGPSEPHVSEPPRVPTSEPADLPTSEPFTPTPPVSLPQQEPTLSPIILSSSSSDGASSPAFDPMTAIVVYTPPSSSSSFTFPTLFPDDKGGEE